MKILVLGSAEVVAAFAMGGMDGRAVKDRAGFRIELEKCRRRDEIGILVIEEGLARLEQAEVDRLKLDPHAPLIVEVPGFGGPLPERQTPLDVVRRALGISL